MKKIVFGILAHVDSGKTTLSEAMLYLSGEIRKRGRVDHGDTFLDTDVIERDRGITIFSKQAIFSRGDTEFTLVDTPGHVDFSTETERTLSVLDCAVLVISGSDGVQSHTETLWRLLDRYNIPTFIFVNKMDLNGTDRQKSERDIKTNLSDGCLDFSRLGTSEFSESAAMCDEEILNAYLSTGEISGDLLSKAIWKREIFPVFFGSALKCEGIDELLDALGEYSVMPNYTDEFGAVVYKISEDERGTRLTHMKITGGTLKVKDVISGEDRNGTEWSEKIDGIRLYSGEKFNAVPFAEAGTVCAVCGLSRTYSGEGLGKEQNSRGAVLSPVLSYTAQLPEGVDIHAALRNFRTLEEEEPELGIIWNEQLKEIQIRLMGEIQTEVLKRIMSERFNMDVEFVKGNIAYKETIKNIVEGVGHYEPLRHYAEVHLILEPGKPGSGLKFAAKCSEDKLDRNWQRLILTHLKEKTHLGVLTGSPITDMKITLVSGRAHKKHTEGGDFRQATYRAVRQGLRQAECVLLEPWYDIKISVPNDCVGRAMSDVIAAGGKVNPPETDGNTTVITGSAPVEGMIDYGRELSAYTGGRGKITCIASGYFPCADAEKVIEKIGYDCDADTENTADSIFCSHGAGYSVRWDEVPQHMHLESELKRGGELEIEGQSRERAKAFVDGIAADKELMRIFERTYGPNRRDLLKNDPVLGSSAAMPPRGQSVEKFSSPHRPKPKQGGTEYLLVDGYNIIFAWDELKKYADDSMETARMKLADILCNYRGFRKCEIILVYDAYKVKNNPGEVERYHNINIVYTKERETADMYIEKTSHKLSKNNRVRVATSDGLEQLIILGGGALRISASDLRDEIREAEREIEEYMKSLNLHGNSEQRIEFAEPEEAKK